jgi:hypothetical protein
MAVGLLLVSDLIVTTLLARLNVAVMVSGMVLANINLSPRTTGLPNIANTMWAEFISAMMNPAYLPGIMTLESSVPRKDIIALGFGAWFYGTYATSIWLWLYVVSTVLVKGAQAAGVATFRMRWFLDLRNQPFRSLGFVSALITFVVLLSMWPLLGG